MQSTCFSDKFQAWILLKKLMNEQTSNYAKQLTVEFIIQV